MTDLTLLFLWLTFVMSGLTVSYAVISAACALVRAYKETNE